MEIFCFLLYFNPNKNRKVLMEIIRITQAKANYVHTIQRLLPQLTANPSNFDMDILEQILSAPDTFLLAAVKTDAAEEMVGMLTLTIYRIPTGVQARIDDVVVANAAREQGIGRALMEKALQICRQNSVRTISLSSHPRRVAANRLYPKLGFEQRETNVYFLKTGT